MSIGNRTAFPSDTTDPSCDSGMTYRQWLIGMALQGVLASDTDNAWTDETISRLSIDCADAVIERLDTEQEVE